MPEKLLKATIVLKDPGSNGVMKILDTATAFWHMDDDNRQSTDNSRLTLHGTVELGVALEGAEREASLRRGGNGIIAQFDGGHLIVGLDAADPLRLTGDTMTFAIRVRDQDGTWDTPLFARHAPDDTYGSILHPAKLNTHIVGYSQSKRIKHGTAIEYLWRTTPLTERVLPEYFEQGEKPNLFRFHTQWEEQYGLGRKGDFLNGILRLQTPTDLIDTERWHDIIVRFDRVKIEMFVDGVLLDEDWTHGNLHQFQGPFLIGAGYREGRLCSGFHGQIDHIGLWNRALTDEEISALSGGREETSRCDREILGPRNPVGQYWRPHGYNTSVGDCMAFAHDDTFHIFFLSDRRHGGSKWGLQALPWGHVSTRDFIHWDEHPCPLDITEPWECCLGTGSLAYHDGRYYLFYIKHDRRAWFADNPNFGDTIFVATSDDGIHFKKDPKALLVPGFFNENDINPDVYPNQTDGGYLLSLSNWKVWKTTDMKRWEETAPLSAPQWWICTSHFKWNEWYYFTSLGRYWMSRQPIESAEAWHAPGQQGLWDGIKVPQVAALNGRHIMVGFTPPPPNACYGGELLVRELIQHPDGILGTKWLKEMIPESGTSLSLPFKATLGNAVAEDDVIRISAPAGFAVGTLERVPQDVRITLRVNPEPGTRHFGLCVRGKGEYQSGCELQFCPSDMRVQFAPVTEGRMAGESGRWTGISSVTDINRPFTLDVIVKDDLIDACIDNRRTLITRNHTRLDGDQLFLFVSHGTVVYENIQVYPLS